MIQVEYGFIPRLQILQTQMPAEVIVLIGGQVVFGILDRGRQAIVAVSVGGIVPGHAAAHGLLDDLYAVIRVVDRLGDAIAASPAAMSTAI